MKSSFSLSSLQPTAGFPESPERARLRLERPYNSLTKKSRQVFFGCALCFGLIFAAVYKICCCCSRRRDPEQEGWRRSWGSHNKDEFWAALQSDYDYLMDNNLIDTCKVGRGPRRRPTGTPPRRCTLTLISLSALRRRAETFPCTTTRRVRTGTGALISSQHTSWNSIPG